ncbi:MAG: hypothetical protein KH135_01645 [Firmicutes bacterium]|nr:hypothetical protein [Bacillota bacterium]
MLKLNQEAFQIQFSECNLRQRNYQDKSFVSISIQTSYYPKMVGKEIVNGTIEMTLDVSNIHSLFDLENKSYTEEEIKVAISTSRNGAWTHDTFYDGKVSFQKRHGNTIEFSLTSEKGNLVLETTATIVSLYTTSTKEKDLKKVFDMNDFYEIPIRKEIQTREILKYIAKNAE